MPGSNKNCHFRTFPNQMNLWGWGLSVFGKFLKYNVQPECEQLAKRKVYTLLKSVHTDSQDPGGGWYFLSYVWLQHCPQSSDQMRFSRHMCTLTSSSSCSDCSLGLWPFRSSPWHIGIPSWKHKLSIINFLSVPPFPILPSPFLWMKKFYNHSFPFLLSLTNHLTTSVYPCNKFPYQNEWMNK